MRLFRIYKCGFIVAFDQHALVNQEIQMRLYSRIYKYHFQVWLFVLAALVYAKSLKKKFKNFKTSSILCEGNVDEESREGQQRWRHQKRQRTGKQQRSKPKNP